MVQVFRLKGSRLYAIQSKLTKQRNANYKQDYNIATEKTIKNVNSKKFRTPTQHRILKHENNVFYMGNFYKIYGT